MLEKDSSNVSFHTIRTFLQLFSHTREKTTPSRGTHVQTCSACVLATRPIFNFLSLSIKDSNTAGVSSGSRLVKQPGWQRDKQAFTPMESWESPEWEHGTKYTGNTLKRSFISQSKVLTHCKLVLADTNWAVNGWAENDRTKQQFLRI